MIEAALETLANRVRMLVGRGRITTGNDSGNVQTQQVKMGAMETGDNRTRIAEFGFTSMPPVGSDAVVLFITGDRTAGIVIGTAHQSSRPRNLQAGEAKVYSVDGKCIYFALDHIEIDANGQNVTVNNAATVTINASTEVLCNTPIFKCTGDIIDNCNTQQNTMAEMRGIYNGHRHPVTQVQGGGSTIISDPPSQPQREDDQGP